jgi:hypothetical protein
VKAGISLHPSHTPVIGLLKEDEKEILKDIKCPQVSSGSKKTISITIYIFLRVFAPFIWFNF